MPSGAVQAGDTTTAARAEAQQPTPEAAQEVHETAEHTKGVAEHAASAAHVCVFVLFFLPFPLPFLGLGIKYYQEDETDPQQRYLGSGTWGHWSCV